ncbi:MAG: DUF4928 family protein [Dehalococcoidales bacterium]|nr:DUF4928 family protein [Dehalococcoidales bacterium]
MNSSLTELRDQCLCILDEWLESCTRGRSISRNTVAVGIVVLDHLRRQCPVTRGEVTSQGGEIRGARAGLGNTLEKYGISSSYLKEVTTRQAPQDGQRLFESLEWGGLFAGLSAKDRDALLCQLIDRLAEIAKEWLRRQSLKLDLNRAESPLAWIHVILEKAKGRSGGIVEQHLVGAKLERRFASIPIPNYPAHAADVQTERAGDFAIQDTVYHVTATPGRGVIQKCAANIRQGQRPVLLVPQEEEYKASALAEDEGIGAQVSIISIEDFLALNIIEFSLDAGRDFFSLLQEIVAIYNRRLQEVETDLSLQIDLQ